MATICPTCGGTQINCPTCNAPPKRQLPARDVYKGAMPMSMTTWEVQGIDISRWNGQMNFSVTKTKCQYVYIRYGYGNGWKDSSSDIFYQGAKAQDMPVGAYWFCNIGEDPIRHADGLVEELLTKPVQLDIVLDYERTILDKSATLEWIKAVDGRVRNRTQKVPMSYTSKGFWDEKVARSANWIGRNLWDANWTTRDTPVLPLDWSGWRHWQWSADGNMKAAEYGSSNGDPDMDLDRFNGSCVNFNAIYGTHIVPIGNTPPIPPGELPYMVVVNTGEMNIRAAPDPLNGEIIGSTKMGQHWYPEAIEKDQYGKEWYRAGKKVFIKKELTRLP